MPLAQLCPRLLWSCFQQAELLQREQSRAEKNTTNVLSIAMLVLCSPCLFVVWHSIGFARVPLSLLVQIVRNIIIDPRKRVDYDDLNAARDEFAQWT